VSCKLQHVTSPNQPSAYDRSVAERLLRSLSSIFNIQSHAWEINPALVLCSDEACFHPSGYRYLSAENLSKCHCVTWKLGCGILRVRLGLLDPLLPQDCRFTPMLHKFRHHSVNTVSCVVYWVFMMTITRSLYPRLPDLKSELLFDFMSFWNCHTV
jgi:hypothetical protein